jgi:hypothetical protein
LRFASRSVWSGSLPELLFAAELAAPLGAEDFAEELLEVLAAVAGVLGLVWADAGSAVAHPTVKTARAARDCARLAKRVFITIIELPMGCDLAW